MAYTYPIQASGSALQLVLHSKRSHDNHPMGGVRARPLSSPATRGESNTATHSNKDEEAAILEASVPLKYMIDVLFHHPHHQQAEKKKFQAVNMFLLPGTCSGQ